MAGMGIHGGKRIKAVSLTVAFLIILLGRNLLWYLLPLFYVYIFSILISDFENYISNIIRQFCEKIYKKVSCSASRVNADEQYCNFLKWK